MMKPLRLALPLVLAGLCACSDAPDTVMVYRDALHCSYSSTARTRGIDCDAIAETAHKLAREYQWKFSSAAQCVKYYGKQSCYNDTPQSVSLKPAAIAYSAALGAFPVFESPLLGTLVSPNSIPLRLGENIIDSNRFLIIPKPLSASVSSELSLERGAYLSGPSRWLQAATDFK